MASTPEILRPVPDNYFTIESAAKAREFSTNEAATATPIVPARAALQPVSDESRAGDKRKAPPKRGSPFNMP
jgi:hypothetical protein